MLPKHFITLFGSWVKFTGKLKPEDRMSVELTQRLVELTLKNKLTAVWFHVPNEAGKNTIFYTMIQRAKGVVAGTSDYIFLRPINPLCLELKVGTKQSPKQEAFQQWCESLGIEYILCRTVDDAIRTLYMRGIIEL